ncbi:hypothetical protein [Thalassococcus lentus]|uniref:Lipoprotein n=1 Tax=Thalassococcus lentus TaxID=1210524 RepID=A0ABT4XXD6_9RHOB|nr:hypothetical protein [Thalassococcus lentus]MDA7426609.1 hypothetical protein [Thalassococcus lentus]
MMTRSITIVAMILALAGCERLGLVKRGTTIENNVYRGSAKAENRKERDYFIATAGPVSTSLDGAIQAAAHQGVQHCIKYYGTSEIEWTVGPDTDADALAVDNDKITLMGRCIDQ